MTGDLGYYTIGMQIDPNDWQNPGVDQIVNATIAGAVRGGGMSSYCTIVVAIVRRLWRRCHRLLPGSAREVSIGPRLGTVGPLTRCGDATIPPDARLSARLTDVGFLSSEPGCATIHYLFLIGIVLGVPFFSSLGRWL